MNHQVQLKKKAQSKIQKLHRYTDFVFPQKSTSTSISSVFLILQKGDVFRCGFPSFIPQLSTASGNCDGPLGASFGLTNVLRGVFDMTYATCDGYLQK